MSDLTADADQPTASKTENTSTDTEVLDWLFKDWATCTTRKHCTETSSYLAICYKCNRTTSMCADHRANFGRQQLREMGCGCLVLTEHVQIVSARA